MSSKVGKEGDDVRCTMINRSRAVACMLIDYQRHTAVITYQKEIKS